MVSKQKQAFRLERVLSSFQDAVFLTLTTPDVVDIVELRDRWRKFRHEYLRHIGKVNYVCVFELHPKGHGFHIHVVFDRGYLPIQIIRKYARLAGFGRVHIEQAYDLKMASYYLVKYLTKSLKYSRQYGVCRVRLINLSRGLLTLKECLSCGNVHDSIMRVINQREEFIHFFCCVKPYLRYRHVLNFILFDRFYYRGRDYDGIMSCLGL